jgi:hypothetical protein
MSLDLDGGRVGYEAGVPRLKDGEAETFCFRRAVEGDIPFIQEVYQTAASRNAIYAVRDESIWRYELAGRSEENIAGRYWDIIERSETHEPVGILARWYHAENYAMLYELKRGASWLEVTPSVVRHLWHIARQLQTQDGRSRPNFGFFHGNKHPVYQVLYDDLPQFRKPYAYFMRVPDVKGFIRHIAPALEKRLASSIAPGYSGALKISFYQHGLLLRFEQGKLTVEEWKPSPSEWGNVAFPELTFLQVLFGYRSFAELHESFADCWWQTETDHALIDILFPKRDSHVVPIG